MACDFTYDDDGNLVGIVCSTPWGIGTYRMPAECADYEGESMYGFPPRGMNPHDFTPDLACCTPEEVIAWKEACDAWDAEVSK